ncbi:FAD-binding oxidoreductase [Rathayibacter soli]|uniref:FAD-binding oxidoreductase n=1 Tax=Rathayibacter soli TaxID=3144168 RepID=UPI0027E476F4|nr:FAD-binding oxidoreductase [Glaciibacter superstes]
MTADAALTAESIAELRSQVAGAVFGRDDDDIAAEVACFNRSRTQDPDIVVGAANEADVAAAVRFAVRHGLPVRVQATGHGSGKPPAGGVMITTKRLDNVRIDPQTRLATLGAGVLWQSVVEAAATFDLAPIVGSSVSVGAIGYTLGGGLGPLARSHGLSSDWARRFRVITATGEITTADAHTNTDLFWALRGGKGGFGVVTEMTIELAPIPALYAGGLYFEGAENIEAALRGWAAWLPDAPARVSTSVALLRLPDKDDAPDDQPHRSVLHLRFAYPGELAEGERLAAPLRALAPVQRDTIAALPLADIRAIHEDPEEPLTLKSFCIELSALDPELVTAFLQSVGPGSDSPFFESELRHLGSAVAKDTADTTAAGGREGALMLRLVATGKAEFPAAAARAAQLFASAKRLTVPITSVNFAGDMAVPANFDAAWSAPIRDRLAQVRALYDPDGVFPFGPQQVAALGNLR